MRSQESSWISQLLKKGTPEMFIHGAPQPHPSPLSPPCTLGMGGGGSDSPLALGYPQPITVQRELSSTI